MQVTVQQAKMKWFPTCIVNVKRTIVVYEVSLYPSGSSLQSEKKDPSTQRTPSTMLRKCVMDDALDASRSTETISPGGMVTASSSQRRTVDVQAHTPSMTKTGSCFDFESTLRRCRH